MAGRSSESSVEAAPGAEAGALTAREVALALADIGRHRSYIIPALQAVQERIGWLPPATFKTVGAHFNVPESRIYGIATFYAQFYLTRQGRHKVRLCRGTACHVRGSSEILSALEEKLGIATGETTPDLKFTLERVACFGSCALAPVVVIDDDVHGRMTKEKTLKLIEELE